MRFHVVALPHTVTSPEYSVCAYTQKVRNFCAMMTSLGHEVFHYGTEGSQVAGEHVTIITPADQERFGFNTDWRVKHFNATFDSGQPYWQFMNAAASQAIQERERKGDFLCIIGGLAQDPIKTNLCMPVEYGVGYYGICKDFRVFESYTHQASVYSRRKDDPDVNLYDAVIPNSYDPKEFPLVPEKKNYLLYMGRLIRRKGLQIVVDVARATGQRIVVAGQGLEKETPEAWITQDGVELPKDLIDYRGTVSGADRAKLLGEARALICPTLYMEPFGGVVVEAHLCGTPTITTDHAAFSETVTNAFNGYRCRTLDEFCQATEGLSHLKGPAAIHAEALKYSIGSIRLEYHRYFERLSHLWGDGWYHLSKEYN